MRNLTKSNMDMIEGKKSYTFLLKGTLTAETNLTYVLLFIYW
jgi:hypothetical protein